MDTRWAAIEFGVISGAAGGGSMRSKVADVSWGVFGIGDIRRGLRWDGNLGRGLFRCCDRSGISGLGVS